MQPSTFEKIMVRKLPGHTYLHFTPSNEVERRFQVMYKLCSEGYQPFPDFWVTLDHYCWKFMRNTDHPEQDISHCRFLDPTDHLNGLACLLGCTPYISKQQQKKKKTNHEYGIYNLGKRWALSLPYLTYRNLLRVNGPKWLHFFLVLDKAEGQ